MTLRFLMIHDEVWLYSVSDQISVYHAAMSDSLSEDPKPRWQAFVSLFRSRVVIKGNHLECDWLQEQGDVLQLLKDRSDLEIYIPTLPLLDFIHHDPTEYRGPDCYNPLPAGHERVRERQYRYTSIHWYPIYSSSNSMPTVSCITVHLQVCWSVDSHFYRSAGAFSSSTYCNHENNHVAPSCTTIVWHLTWRSDWSGLLRGIIRRYCFS
jgi:hypothetical protein